MVAWTLVALLAPPLRRPSIALLTSAISASEVSGDGLITRTSSQIAANAKLQSFTARYVRLYGLPTDDDNYSISEVQLLNTATGNPVVSKGKLTWGPEPLETDGELWP